MSRTLEMPYEERARGVILPEALLAAEPALSPYAASAEDPAQASSPAQVEEFRDRPTLPMLG